MYIAVIFDRKEEGEPSPFNEPLLKEIAGRIGKTIAQVSVSIKSGKFGHQVNSDTSFANSGNPDETAPYEPSHQDFHCLLS